MLANRMTPATPVTQRDEIKSAKEGFLYKRRTAVCQMLPVTQNDGRCAIWFMEVPTRRPPRPKSTSGSLIANPNNSNPAN